jgi:hypothetical protein
MGGRTVGADSFCLHENKAAQMAIGKKQLVMDRILSD